MPQTFDLVLANGTVVNQDGAFPRDVGVRDGRIAGIGDLSADSAGERIDCKGLHVLPGVIDSQVHFREPGPVHKEDLETGSRAAVLGGVTAVFEMPNTDPTTTTAEALADKMRRAKGRMHCDFAFWVGATHDNVADIPELERLPGAAGIKVFMGSSTGRLLVADDEGVLAILKQIRRRAAFHSEDEARLNERKGLRVAGDPSSHPLWRDEIAALRSTERLVRLAREARAQAHVLHVSTREEMEFLAEAKDVATCEATPHHLTLSADDYPRLGTKLQMNPPVRGGEASRGDLARARAGRRRRAGVRSRAPHARGESKALSRQPLGHDRGADAGSDHARPRQRRAAHFAAFRRPDQRRPGEDLPHSGQGPHRRRLRRRLHRRRHEASRDDPRFLDRLALELDALRRQESDGLAGRDDFAWPPRDVGGGAYGAVDRRGGAVLVRRG